MTSKSAENLQPLSEDNIDIHADDTMSSDLPISSPGPELLANPVEATLSHWASSGSSVFREQLGRMPNLSESEDELPSVTFTPPVKLKCSVEASSSTATYGNHNKTSTNEKSVVQEEDKILPQRPQQKAVSQQQANANDSRQFGERPQSPKIKRFDLCYSKQLNTVVEVVDFYHNGSIRTRDPSNPKRRPLLSPKDLFLIPMPDLHSSLISMRNRNSQLQVENSNLKSKFYQQERAIEQLGANLRQRE